MKAPLIFVFTILVGIPAILTAQTKKEIAVGRFDSTGAFVKTDTLPRKISKNDTLIKASHSPKKATLRSALIPGWGQVYNKQIWKVPLVYAVVGIPAATYFYNNSWYKKSRFAFQLRVDKDSANFGKIDPRLQVLSTPSLQLNRNEFRRSRDYSIIYTLLAWGLNVVDATVSGHLKEFDVSDDLSLQINPMVTPLFNSNGISVILAFKQPTRRVLQVK